jgi:hypothetical protein
MSGTDGTLYLIFFAGKPGRPTCRPFCGAVDVACGCGNPNINHDWLATQCGYRSVIRSNSSWLHKSSDRVSGLDAQSASWYYFL